MNDTSAARDDVVTGAEAVATLLRRVGVHEVFGYIGTSELAMAAALRQRSTVFRNARGDKEAAFMAAGASALRPARAAALLHGARGLTNATGALADVWRNEVGLVCLTGLPSTASQPFLPPHGEPRLVETVGHFVKRWFEVPALPRGHRAVTAAARDLVRTVAAAVRIARTPPCGPVLLGVPQDVMEARWVPAAVLREAVPQPSPAAPAAGLAEAVRRVEQADRPVVLFDDYLLKDPRATQTLRTFTDRLGAPALQVRYRRGPMLFERISRRAVPAFLGWYDPDDPAHVGLLRGADLIITVEDRNMYPRVVGDLPGTDKLAFTCAPERTRKNGYLIDDDLVVDGDTCANLAMVAASLRRPTRPPRPLDAEASGSPRAAVRAPLWPVAEAFGRSLAEVDQPVVVDDSQMFGGLLAQAYGSLPEGTRVLGDHGGFVGGGLATAVGVALGNPERTVVCTLGDQGFTNGMQALAAAVEHRARLTLVVCNNGGSVSLRKQLGSMADVHRADEHLDNVPQLDYVRLATAFGMPAHRLVWPAPGDATEQRRAATRLRDLFRRHQRHDGPSLLELVLPGDAAAWAGVWEVSGLEQRPVEVPA